MCNKAVDKVYPLSLIIFALFFLQLILHVLVAGTGWLFNTLAIIFIVITVVLSNCFYKILIVTKSNVTWFNVTTIISNIIFIPLFTVSIVIHFNPFESGPKKNQYTGKIIPKVFLGKACRIEGKCLTDVAVFYGGINKESKEAFETFINENSVKTVCLSSGGGKTEEAEYISNIIMDKKLNTCMADYYYSKEDAGHLIPLMSLGCNSACNLLLLSSDVRIRNATLVLFKGHQYAETNQYRQVFEWWGWGWNYISTNISEEPAIVAAFKKLKTIDNDAHVRYSKELEKLGHLADMKQLNDEMLKEFKIFTKVIPKNEN